MNNHSSLIACLATEVVLLLVRIVVVSVSVGCGERTGIL